MNKFQFKKNEGKVAFVFFLGNLLKIRYNINMPTLNPRSKYLQIAFNRSLTEVNTMLYKLPASPKILIEAGTPFIKQYGSQGISSLKSWWSSRIKQPGYIVADLKCMDRGFREVDMAAQAGASAATCLALAPVETINQFIVECDNSGMDSMVDMMNIEFPFEVLQKLRKLPTVVVLHRGVDENELNKNKMLLYDQIQRIKGAYNNILISIAGGENLREVRRTFFNGADIAVVWKPFYQNPSDTANLANELLSAIK